MKEKAYEVARNPKYDRYGWVLASMVYKCFDKKTVSRVNINEKLAEELHKSAIKKFKKGLWKIWRQHLGSRFGNVKYLSCAIDISTKDAWVKSLTEKRLLMLLSKY